MDIILKKINVRARKFYCKIFVFNRVLYYSKGREFNLVITRILLVYSA